MKSPQDMNPQSLTSNRKATPDYSGGEDVVNKIMIDLKAMKSGWRAKFKSQKELDLYKEQLLKACYENGVNTIEQIEVGLKEARKDESDFFPSVGKFIKWCKPDEHWEHKQQNEYAKIPKDRRLAKLSQLEINEIAQKHIKNMKEILRGK